MKKNSSTLEALLHGQVLLTRVRKIHNTDPKRTADHLDYKVQIECAEFIDNPYRPINAASVFNTGDSRFSGNRPRRGWVTLEPAMWTKFFGALVPLAEVAKLDWSSVTGGDVDDASQLVEGKHFITLNVLNPSVELKPGKATTLHVQILEGTVQRNENQPSKKNPALNAEGQPRQEGEDMQEQTRYGQPIYTQNSVNFETEDGKIPASRFLVSDQMIRAHKAGTLLLPDAAIEEYAANAPQKVSEKATSDATVLI